MFLRFRKSFFYSSRLFRSRFKALSTLEYDPGIRRRVYVRIRKKCLACWNGVTGTRLLPALEHLQESTSEMSAFVQSILTVRHVTVAAIKRSTLEHPFLCGLRLCRGCTCNVAHEEAFHVAGGAPSDSLWAIRGYPSQAWT